MNSSLKMLAAAGKWIRDEVAEIWPIFLFFVVGFLIQLLIVKLVLARFSIPVTALSKAVIGAFMAAKAVLILDSTPLARRLKRHRRIVAVAVKTFLYGFIALLLGCIERFLDAKRRVGTFNGAARSLMDREHLFPLLAWAIGISVVFAIYFAWLEISERVGKGVLWSLFFEPPQITNGSDRQSGVVSVK